jgi:hypothetical protein
MISVQKESNVFVIHDCILAIHKSKTEDHHTFSEICSIKGLFPCLLKNRIIIKFIVQFI